MKAATGEDPLQRLPAVAGAGNQADLRDRLLHVAAVRADASAAEAIWAVIEADRSAGRTPPAMAILAAGKLRLARAAPVVKQLLGDLAAGRGEFTEGQVLALLDAADRLAVPVRAEVFALVERLWNPREHQLVLVRSARLLGRQAVLPQPPGQPAPPTEDCIRLLRQAALYAAAPATRPAGEEQVRTTPVPSAAAAAALWLMRPAESMYKPPPAGTQPAGVWEIDLASAAYYVRQAAGARTTLPGDYLAWHLGRSGRPEALGLGRQMLPPPPDPNVPLSLQPPREYAENERAAGAMLLALAQHGSRQDAARARELIASRLEGGVFGPEDDFFTAGAYRCALLILGRQDQAATVRELLGTKDFPQRRAFTALAAAGKRGATDWLLWNPQIGREDIAFLLIGKGLAEVLAAAAPDLPTVDECAGTDLLHWQVRILQDEYAIRRGRLAIGLSSPGGPAEASRPARGEPTP